MDKERDAMSEAFRATAARIWQEMRTAYQRCWDGLRQQREHSGAVVATKRHKKRLQHVRHVPRSKPSKVLASLMSKYEV